MRSILLLLTFIVSFVGFDVVYSQTTVSVVGNPAENSFSVSTQNYPSGNFDQYASNGFGYLIMPSTSATAPDFQISVASYPVANNTPANYSLPVGAFFVSVGNAANMSSNTAITSSLVPGTSYWVRSICITEPYSFGPTAWTVLYSQPINVTTLPSPPTYNTPVVTCNGNTTVGSLFLNGNSQNNGTTYTKLTYDSQGNSIASTTPAVVGQTYSCKISASYPSSGSSPKESSTTSLTVSQAYSTPVFINNPSSLTIETYIYSFANSPQISFNGNIKTGYWIASTNYPVAFIPENGLQLLSAPASPLSLQTNLINHNPNSSKYYRFVASEYCGTSFYDFNRVYNIFRLPTPTNTNYASQVVCSNSQINQLATPGTFSSNGRDYTWAFFPNATTTTPFVGSEIAQATTYYVRYKLVENGTTYYSDTYTTVDVTVMNPTAGAISGTQSICSGSIPAILTSATNGEGTSNTGTVTYQWQTGTTTISGANSSTLQQGALTATASYQRLTVATSGSTVCYSAFTAPVTITVLTNNWIGSNNATVTPAEFNNGSNWGCGVVPSTPTIPTGTTLYFNGVFNFTNLTVECGASLIITETGRVTISNVLTNGGLVQISNGGTIKYGSTVDGSCAGTYKSTETFVTDRFWYVGPTTAVTPRSAFGSLTTGSGNGTQMWSWNEATNASNGYILPVYSNNYLIPGNGYVYRNLGGSLEVNQTGPFVTSAISRTGLSRTGTGSLAGYHLISNPYTAYLNADDIFSVSNTGTSNMVSSIWVRSNSVANGGPGTMVFDTYNATSGIGTGLGWQAVALNGNPTNINNLMKWIAPMQGFWVRVNTTGNGSVAYNYAMSNANPTGAGQLRSTSSIAGLARLNVTFGTQKDQMVAALSANATNAFEAYDSEKMFTSGVVQLYAPNSGKKLAINTLKNNKSKVSMPLTVECPGAGWYTFDLVELDLDNGVLFLEDKLNGEMKDLTLDSTYQFYATSGVLQNRFILHFHLPSQISNVSGPSSLEDLVSESQNATIEIASTSTGKVTVTLDQVDEVTNSAVRICDLNGRVIDSFMADGKSFDFQINQGQGAYLIEVTNGLTVEKKKVFIQ